MTTMAASKAREDFSEVLARVAYGKERVVLHRHKKVMVAVVPVEDLKLLEALEDHIDLADARAALAGAKKKGTKSLQIIKKELGL